MLYIHIIVIHLTLMSVNGMEKKKYEFIEQKQIKVQDNIKIIIYEKLKLFLFKKNINCIENIFIFSFIILYDFFLIIFYII